MLLNFKSSHLPNTTGQHLCKVQRKMKKGKTKKWFMVVWFNHKKKQWLNPINRKSKFKFEVVSWVRIREN